MNTLNTLLLNTPAQGAPSNALTGLSTQNVALSPNNTSQHTASAPASFDRLVDAQTPASLPLKPTNISSFDAELAQGNFEDLTALANAFDLTVEELAAAAGQLLNTPITTPQQLRAVLTQSDGNDLSLDALVNYVAVTPKENLTLPIGKNLPTPPQTAQNIISTEVTTTHQITDATTTQAQNQHDPVTDTFPQQVNPTIAAGSTNKTADEAIIASTAQAVAQNTTPSSTDIAKTPAATQTQTAAKTITQATESTLATVSVQTSTTNTAKATKTTSDQAPTFLVPRNDPSLDQSVKQIAAKIATTTPFSAAQNAEFSPSTTATVVAENVSAKQATTTINNQLAEIAQQTTAATGEARTKTTPTQNNAAQQPLISQAMHTLRTNNELHSSPTQNTLLGTVDGTDNQALSTLQNSANIASNGSFVEQQQIMQGEAKLAHDVTQTKIVNEQTIQATNDAAKAEAVQTRGAESRAYTTAAEQVSLKITKALQTGNSNIEVHLDPAKLGKVSVNIAIQHNGQVSVTMTAERQDTLDLLRSDAKSLERSLADAGLSSGGNTLNFGLKGQQQQHNPYQNFHNAYSSQAETEDEALLTTLSSSSNGQIMMSDRALDIHA